MANNTERAYTEIEIATTESQHLNDMEPPELLDLLKKELEKQDDCTFDSDLVEKCIDILQKKAPVMEEFDSQNSFAKFREKYADAFEAAFSS